MKLQCFGGNSVAPPPLVACCVFGGTTAGGYDLGSVGLLGDAWSRSVLGARMPTICCHKADRTVQMFGVLAGNKAVDAELGTLC